MYILWEILNLEPFASRQISRSESRQLFAHLSKRQGFLPNQSHEHGIFAGILLWRRKGNMHHKYLTGNISKFPISSRENYFKSTKTALNHGQHFSRGDCVSLLMYPVRPCGVYFSYSFNDWSSQKHPCSPSLMGQEYHFWKMHERISMHPGSPPRKWSMIHCIAMVGPDHYE